MLSILSRSRLVRANIVLVSAIVAAACGSDTSTVGTNPPPVAKDVTPAAVTSNVTGALSGTVGTQLATSIGVTVTNKAGDLLDTIPVIFTVTSGGGTVSSTTVKTTAGKASTTWILGPSVGTQTVTATVASLAPVTFTATATAGAASKLAKLSTDPQTAAAGANVASPPSVKVTDANNNPIGNVLVSFAVASGGGSVTGNLAQTDANGIATAGAWKLGTSAGVNTVTATATGITAPVTFTATGVAGAASAVAFTTTPPATLNIGATYTAAAKATDANGNAVVNPAFTFSSDNTAIATVNASTGVVTAVGAGNATITVALNGITASQGISVIGRPGATVAASLPMGSRIKDVVSAGLTAYAALSTAGSVSAIDLPTSTVAWTLALGGTVADVGVNAANTRLVAAVAFGGANELYAINPATHVVTDSVALAAPPVRLVSSSTGDRVIVDENSFQIEIVDWASKSVVAMLPLPGTVTAMKMAAGDSLFYAGTTLGTVYEVNAKTGAVVRTFQPSNTVMDLDISPDGKTLFVADGSTSVSVIRLFTGGLATQTIDYGASNINGVGMSPDATQLWVSMGNTEYASPRDGAGFNTGLIPGRVAVPGTNLSRVTFSRTGNVALVIDEAGNQVIVFK